MVPSRPLEQVAPDVWLVALPLPWELESINVFLLKRRDGLLLIDCGLRTEESLGQLESALADLQAGWGDIRQIVVSHMHADHAGAAATLRERSGAPILMEPREAELVKPREPGQLFFGQAEIYLREHGAEEALIAKLKEVSGRASSVTERFEPDGLLRDGDTLTYRQGILRVMSTPGHSPGLLSFFDAGQRLLFSTDVILEGITPNIGIHPFYEGDPLGEYLDSLARLAALDVDLVLPSHGNPFRGHCKWIQETRLHHEERLEAMLAGLQEGETTAHGLVPRVWTRKLGLIDSRLALAESLAHLEYLRRKGRVNRHAHNGQAIWSLAS